MHIRRQGQSWQLFFPVFAYAPYEELFVFKDIVLNRAALSDFRTKKHQLKSQCFFLNTINANPSEIACPKSWVSCDNIQL
jgi:hypothetical protein